jgi:hypothetical protein
VAVAGFEYELGLSSNHAVQGQVHAWNDVREWNLNATDSIMVVRPA